MSHSTHNMALRSEMNLSRRSIQLHWYWRRKGNKLNKAYTQKQKNNTETTMTEKYKAKLHNN